MKNGVMFAMFNPYLTSDQVNEFKKGDNPTKDLTLVSYTDEELKGIFPRFKLEKFKVYPELLLRALFLRFKG